MNGGLQDPPAGGRTGPWAFPRDLTGAALKVTKAVRSRPKITALVLALLLLAGPAGGLYAYALRQWYAAQATVKKGWSADARAGIDLCLAVWPRSVPVHLLAARAARLRGDFADAEAHLNRCLQLHGGATDAIQLEFLLVRVQTGEEDDVSRVLWQRVENKDPDTPVILETLAWAYIRNYRYGPALACLDRWIKEAPDAAEPYFLRAWVRERQHSNQDALSDYQRAVELDPDHVAARLRLAELYLGKSDPPSALPHLERLSKQFPDRPDIMARLGQCRFLQGQMGEARRLLEAAAEKRPEDTQVLIHLGKLELQENRPPEAEQWLRRALKVDPFDTEAQYALATCLQYQGRRDEAAAAMEECRAKRARLKEIDELLENMVVDRSPDDPNAAAEVGVALLRVGQERQGVYWLEQALKRNPGHQPAHKALAEYYEGKGDRQQAAAHRRWLPHADREGAAP
jgi:tetratricopeptide (TPR) repeat protein